MYNETVLFLRLLKHSLNVKFTVIIFNVIYSQVTEERIYSTIFVEVRVILGKISFLHIDSSPFVARLNYITYTGPCVQSLKRGMISNWIRGSQVLLLAGRISTLYRARFKSGPFSGRYSRKIPLKARSFF